ncbi:MAG: DUF4116 domain-containing protein [Parachlamydiaceae bacterium]|nr:DUF4116 domain-containing protein [Parachlamydiaceae bacterium]
MSKPIYSMSYQQIRDGTFDLKMKGVSLSFRGRNCFMLEGTQKFPWLERLKKLLLVLCLGRLTWGLGLAIPAVWENWKEALTGKRQVVVLLEGNYTLNDLKLISVISQSEIPAQTTTESIPLIEEPDDKVGGIISKEPVALDQPTKGSIQVEDVTNDKVQSVVGVAGGTVKDELIGIQLLLDKPENGGNREMVLKAVNQEGMALEHTDKSLKADYEIVLAAVMNNGLALQFAKRKLRKNEEICTAAVGQNGLALKFVSRKLRSNDDICIAAVKQNGAAFKYVSKEKKDDPDIIMEAVSNDGMVYTSLSDRSKHRKSILLKAVAQNASVIQHAPSDMVENPDIRAEAIKQNPASAEFFNK